MAGNGGFKSALNGFDRNEVNDYISEMSRKLQEKENEIKELEAKSTAASRSAAEADAKIRSIEETNAAKVQELETQVKTERRKSDLLQNDIDELKRKLRNAGSSTGSSGGGAGTAEAERRSAEIIENANATARDIVEKAKKAAQQITASAGSAGGSGVSADAVKMFRDILGGLSTAVSEALKTANEKASAISVSAGGAPLQVDIPDFSNITAPQAAVPETRSAKPAKAVGSVEDVFADMMDDGGDMTDFGDPMDQGKSASDLDMFGAGDGLSIEEAREEKRPEGMDKEFVADLLTQTIPSTQLKDQLDDDLFAVVQEHSDQTGTSDEAVDFDMGSAESGLDAMNALLGQMGAALESAGGSAGGSMDLESDNSSDNSSGADADDDNPWAAFQNEIKAMEQSGNFVSDPAPQTMEEAPAEDLSLDDPKAPDADDSSIWNFDDMSSGDDMNSGADDDMSSDLFGSF